MDEVKPVIYNVIQTTMFCSGSRGHPFEVRTCLRLSNWIHTLSIYFSIYIHQHNIAKTKHCSMSYKRNTLLVYYMITCKHLKHSMAARCHITSQTDVILGNIDTWSQCNPDFSFFPVILSNLLEIITNTTNACWDVYAYTILHWMYV